LHLSHCQCSSKNRDGEEEVKKVNYVPLTVPLTSPSAYVPLSLWVQFGCGLPEDELKYLPALIKKILTGS
jgi:hypothetical protein